MSEFGQQQANGVGAPCHQAARHPIRLVIEFLGAPQHTLARGFADPALVAQDLRDRHHGDFQVFRDVHHGCGHDGASIPPIQGLTIIHPE